MRSSDIPALGVIGRLASYQMADLTIQARLEMDTPFGPPSSPMVIGELAGVRVAFLARHGIGHVLLPSEVNYRANIAAFKLIGIDWLVSISACGRFESTLRPGTW